MFNSFTKTIEKYCMISQGEKVLVGVSGGIDSMVLLTLLQKFIDRPQERLVIVHLNHSLRGEESDEDENFVKDTARGMQIPCITKKVDVGTIAKEKGLNLQDAARMERYSFFEAIRSDLNFDRLALGHNADDQAETMLMRIIRGSGIKGLGGIPPLRGTIIRPLIELTREDISSYATKNSIDFREDSSNLKTTYLRNKLRHELIPSLKEYNPRILNELSMLSSINRDVESYLQVEAEKAFKEASRAANVKNHPAATLTLDLTVFNKIARALKAKVIMMAVERLTGTSSGLFSQHILDVERLAMKGMSGRSINLPKGVMVSVEYNKLIYSLASKSEDNKGFRYPLEIPGETHISEAGIVLKAGEAHDIKGSLALADINTIYIDMKKFVRPLEIRSFMPGDRIKIKGMTGRKKLKDLFIDEKIPQALRRKIPILVSGDEILWVIGLRKSIAVISPLKTGDLIRVQSLVLSC